MKRLLVSEVFPPQHGGSGRWFYEVYRRMPAGTSVVVAGEHARAWEFDRASGLPTERAPLRMDQWGVFGGRGLARYWRLAATIRNLARKHQAQELHVARCLPEGFAAWILWTACRIPYVVYVHGEETRTSATSRELSWMTRRAYGAARYLIANSRNTARVLEEEWGISASRIRILHPGVDAQRFVPAAPDPGVRQALGWTDRRVVLTVGRLQIRKGHDMLIRALPLLRARVPNVLYAIVGDGEERERLEALALERKVADAVRFHGELTDRELVQCYQQCDVFALPNREVNGDFEGFGMVLVEAQACGKPVLAGSSGGTRETMEAGRTGEIGDCSATDFLVEALGRLLLDEPRRASMGSAARDWAVANFSWERLSAQAQAMFTESPLAAFSRAQHDDRSSPVGIDDAASKAI